MYLFSDGSDLVPVSWQEISDGSQLLCTVADVPHLIVKVPAHRHSVIPTYVCVWCMVYGVWSMYTYVHTQTSCDVAP